MVGVASAALGVSLEERCDRARRAGDDDHRPQLEHDVDDPARAGERVLELRRDGEQLDGREEERVAERLHLGAVRVALGEVDRDGSEEVDDDGRLHDDREPREQTAVPRLVGHDPPPLVANRAHVASVAIRAEGVTPSCACLTPRNRPEQGLWRSRDTFVRVSDTYGANRVRRSARPRLAAKPSARRGRLRSHPGPSPIAQKIGNAYRLWRPKLCIRPEPIRAAATTVAYAAHGRYRGPSRQSTTSSGSTSAHRAPSTKPCRPRVATRSSGTKHT